MAYEPRDFSGSLFRNDKKEKENQPDFKGNIIINGTKFWLSGWAKKSTDGASFISLSAQPVTPKVEQGNADEFIPDKGVFKADDLPV